MTNDELNQLADAIFNPIIESEWGDDLTPTERTIVMAKIAARCATYAGDMLDF